jgi:hypothetical protein
MVFSGLFKFKEFCLRPKYKNEHNLKSKPKTKLFFTKIKNTSSGVCTVVELSPHHLEVEGSRPANSTRTGREKNDKEVTKVTKNY